MLKIILLMGNRKMVEKEPELQVKELLFALLNGEFRKASDSEMEGFAGCQGEGWIWCYHNGCAIVDFMGDHMIAQIFESSNEIDEVDHAWNFNPEDRCFEQLY